MSTKQRRVQHPNNGNNHHRATEAHNLRKKTTALQKEIFPSQGWAGI